MRRRFCVQPSIGAQVVDNLTIEFHRRARLTDQFLLDEILKPRPVDPTKENMALNLAGVFAVGVALLPTAAADQPSSFHSVLHGTLAVLFFAGIAYVSLFRSRDTLPLLPAAKRASYARRYFWTGLALILSPLAAVGVSFVLDPASRFRTMIFWLEALAVWTFAAYWMVKTLEMRETDAERRALDAELERTKQPTPSGEAESVVPAHGS